MTDTASATVVRAVQLPETDASTAALARDLAAMVAEESDIRDRAKEAAASFREQIESKHAEAALVAERITHGFRNVDVRCILEHDLARQAVVYRCAELDHPDFKLGQQVDERPFNAEEVEAAMNPELPGVQAAPVQLPADICSKCKHPRDAHQPSCVACAYAGESCISFVYPAPDKATAEALLDPVEPPPVDDPGDAGKDIPQAAAGKGKKTGPGSGKAKGKKAKNGDNGTTTHA